MSNFKFLEKIDIDLFKIVSDAEKLYRDEYFEQAVIQMRRFAESVCKNLLADRYIADSTFDESLSMLQDIMTKSIRERELINDLYFLKSQGNLYAHGTKVKQDGNIALDCMKRAFEVSINYALIKGENKKIERLEFSEETLILGDKKKKGSLKEKYLEKKKTAKKNTQLYKKKKAQVNTYTYPSHLENPKSVQKFNFIGGIILILSVIIYIYITFWK
jgi:hypothetical protein